MNNPASKPDGPPSPNAGKLKRPVLLRLVPYYSFALVIAFLVFFRPVSAWLEWDMGFGFVGALATLGLAMLLLLVIPLLAVLAHEHRRNRM